jgi:hypothetical protein
MKTALWTLIVALLFSFFACETGSTRPGAPQRDSETERLQREVDSLRRIKEDLQNQLNGLEDLPSETDPDPGPLPAEPGFKDEDPGGPIQVLSAKKQINSDFKPVLVLNLKNRSDQPIRSISLAVDFSYNSTKLSENCHFEKTISLSIAPGASKTTTLSIPESYDKTCADKAWVVVKEVAY